MEEIEIMNPTEITDFNGLNGIQKEILQLFFQENRDLYLALIEKKIPRSHSWLQENLKKLLSLGLLSRSEGLPKFYSLTKKGNAFSQRVGTPDIRTHGIEFTIPIIQKPTDWSSDYSNKFIKISDEIRMKNWKEEIRARWDGNFLRISDSSISVFFKDSFWAPSPSVNLLQALFLALEFCRDMEAIHPGLKLGQIGKGSLITLSAQEHAMELPSKSWIEPHQTKIFTVDWSKGYPELEFRDNQKSADQMDRFADFIDAIADGQITVKDVLSVKRIAKQQKKKGIIEEGILFAKMKWMRKQGGGGAPVEEVVKELGIRNL